MFGMAIPLSMVMNMSLSTRGVTHWWIDSRWSQKNIVADDMVQIRQKNKFQMSCMKSVETCFKKSSKNNIASNSPEINKNPSYPQILITVGPLLKRETLFLFFHATGNPLVFHPLRTDESSSTNGVRLFFVGRNLAVLGRSRLLTRWWKRIEFGAVLRKKTLELTTIMYFLNLFSKEKKCWFFRKTPNCKFCPHQTQSPGGFLRPNPLRIWSSAVVSFTPENLRNSFPNFQ